MVTPRSGTRIGHYQVLAPLGAGGMGEVYRALDTKLGRDVALKFLRAEFTGDADRLSRFQREARVLASLNHRHIGQIYGVEDSGGVLCLVLELVEGEDLDQRLARGPVPLEEALKIAKEIAQAIEAAHASGIMHRDLKPANIKLTAGGEVKVLDFGLGKMLEARSTDQSMSPTMSGGATEAHVLLGTLAYMAPEYLRGRPADEKSDIWAFGCVLYELLTRKSVFRGDSAADTMGAITTTDPDWSALPSTVSPNTRRLLRRCLQKDPVRRLQHIGDARIDLEEELSSPAADSVSELPVGRNPSPWLVASSIGLVVGLFVGALLAWSLVPSRTTPAAGPRMQLELGGVDAAPTNFWMAISPDGRQIVFERSQEGIPLFWIRPLDSTEARPLSGTERGMFPFWSPDSRSLAFFADNKLKRIEVAGGPAQVVADATNPRGGAWNSDGTIIFNAASSGPLSRVSLDGRSLGTATELQNDQGSHRYPQFLPDGRHFLYFAIGKPEVSGVYVGSLDGPESKRILASETQAVYSSAGQLLFLRQGVLLAQPFDLDTLELTGAPLPQAERVALGYTGWMSVSAADNGTIAYVTGGGTDGRMTWVDRAGRETGSFGPVGKWATVDLSMDETRVATTKLENGNVDLWMIEVARGIVTRLTTDPADDEDPAWSPDGTRVAFDSNRKGSFDLYELNLASGKETPLFESPQTKIANSWSSDERYLLFGTTDEKSGGNLWALPLIGDRTPVAVVVRDSVQLFGAVSPDNQWVAYDSNESGPTTEIFVQPFLRPGDKRQISSGGGSDPQWSQNGRELFFLATDGTLMAAAVSVSGTQIQSEKPVALFPTTIRRPHSYAVTRDGQRFLLSIPVDKTPPAIRLLLNWAER